ncbi:TLC domain protein [Toxoplasma gondii TgCatPRC2]|uniref:TLC domain protein n=2 Tax=Toxoplasma gondii TaxID=5811 RepID=A0A151HDD7_TOXGO|nr:TLC domain protein [Toxoplasma gondii ARI]KYK67379.1 TLC domain protein [Toxoplasma gondii TgCatPRC2]
MFDTLKEAARWPSRALLSFPRVFLAFLAGSSAPTVLACALSLLFVVFVTHGTCGSAESLAPHLAPPPPKLCYPPSVSLYWIAVSTCLWFVVATLPVHRIPLCFVPALARDRVLRQVADARRTLAAADGEADKKQREEAKEFLLAVRNRSVGFLNAVVVSLLSFACVTLDRKLIDDKFFGCSPLFAVTGFTLVGYFVWDFVVIVWNWSPGAPQWLLHCVVCIFTVANPFIVLPGEPPMSFYAASLILFELSTPFLALRYFMLRAYVFHPKSPEELCEQKDGRDGAPKLPFAYTFVSVAFAVVFFSVRIVWGLGWLIPSLAVAVWTGEGAFFRPWRRYLFYVSIPLFAALNLYWMYMIVASVLFSKRKKKD